MTTTITTDNTYRQQHWLHVLRAQTIENHENICYQMA